MSRGKRYNGEKKLNMKKVWAVIIAILVIIMFFAIIGSLLNEDDSKIKEKTFAIGYYPVLENGKWGVIDTNQKIVIEPQYSEMIVVPDNTKPVFVVISNVDYQTGNFESKVVDKNNNQLYTNYQKVEVIYNHDKNNNLWYEENVLKVKNNEKYGLVNIDGKELLACEYDDILPIEGIKKSYITIKNGKKGLVDNTGMIIADNIYQNIEALTDKYEDSYIVTSENGKKGVIKSNKSLVLEPKYEEIEHVYGNNCYSVKENGNLKIVNEKKETFLEGKYNKVKEINGENIIYEKEGKYGIMNLQGEEKISLEYDDISFAFSEYYIAKKGDKYGIISLTEETKLDFIYSYISYQKEADFIQAQMQNLETSLLDRNFEVKAKGVVSEINTNKNYIRVRDGENYKYYNFKLEEKSNTEILQGNTLFLSKKDGKYGYVDEKGKVIVNYIYDDATEQNKYGYVSVKKDGKWGSLNQKGETILEPTYTLENNLIIDFIGKWHLSEDMNAYYYTK